MKNKKAWLRVIEATMAVMLIAAVLFVMIARVPKASENDIYEKQRFALEQISKNDSARAEILKYDFSAPDPAIEQEIKVDIDKMLPSYLDLDIRICKVEEACGIKALPAGTAGKDIYSDEILITSTLNQYSPKKLRLFVWRK